MRTPSTDIWLIADESASKNSERYCSWMSSISTRDALRGTTSW